MAFVTPCNTIPDGIDFIVRLIAPGNIMMDRKKISVLEILLGSMAFLAGKLIPIKYIHFKDALVFLALWTFDNAVYYLVLLFRLHVLFLDFSNAFLTINTSK
ncbi:MAG TPA: hypothetical protein VMV49_03140 [Candidatus Deferrimicrobium sp.]|nr:hypothetical protein [Candidatus Deferrimicrobium sp.]